MTNDISYHDLPYTHPLMSEWTFRWIRVCQGMGLRNLVMLQGRFGYSELCMHVGFAEKNGLFALVNDQGTYASVLADDGTFVDGSFHLFENGNFSLS